MPTVAELFMAAGLVSPPAANSRHARPRRKGVVAPAVVTLAVVAGIVAAIKLG
jgi:hypothetical protein